MAASGGAPARQPRRGPAPIASFDHDVSDESSPETKQAIRLPEIREVPSSAAVSPGALAPPEARARSHSTPAASGLQTPAAPRIDISRASSSSHHDSRDSSPELALFAGTSSSGGNEEARARLELGFREDGALDLRSSTEELAFLEPVPGEPKPAATLPASERRHSRKDSQGSEAALLAVSGRTSRLSSVGSQCSAHSALSGFSHASKVSRLSVVSGVSRSPSPHKMLLETSFCGPKPIETDPDICAAAVEERLLEMAKINCVTSSAPAPLDARDRREVRTEATVEPASSRPANVGSRPSTVSDTSNGPSITSVTSPVLIAPPPTTVTSPTLKADITDDDKKQKETMNQAKANERRARSRNRRESREPEVRRNTNRSKDIIRIKLKPDSEYEDDDEDESEKTLVGGEALRKPATLALSGAARPTDLAPSTAPTNTTSPTPTRHKISRESRTPSPAGAVVSRKSSFCSLFKSRETIASPDSPSEALRRKKSLTEGRSRSRSRDRSATPTSAAKIRGSVLSLFRTPRKSATSPSPSSRDSSPVVQPHRQIAQPTLDRVRRADRLKYYDDSKDGIIHIPLRTPPDEQNGGGESSNTATTAKVTIASDVKNDIEVRVTAAITHREPTRPSSAPHPRATAVRDVAKPIQRTVLPDGSIIIPLHSPTEKTTEEFPEVSKTVHKIDKETKRDVIVNAVIQEPPQNVSSPKNDQPDVHEKREIAQASVEKKTPLQSPVPKEVDERPRKKERIMFSTHVGSRDQVFSTQFSITKTPSVTSEISESFPSFTDGEEVRTPSTLRDTHITTAAERASPSGVELGGETPEAASSGAASPHEAPRDSSESEPSSEAAPARAGNDVEQRGLVVQESFEEELPYVPTTLPLERSLALPMVPVRERGDVRVAPVQRPRAAHPAAAAAAHHVGVGPVARRAPARPLRQRGLRDAPQDRVDRLRGGAGAAQAAEAHPDAAGGGRRGGPRRGVQLRGAGGVPLRVPRARRAHRRRAAAARRPRAAAHRQHLVAGVRRGGGARPAERADRSPVHGRPGPARRPRRPPRVAAAAGGGPRAPVAGGGGWEPLATRNFYRLYSLLDSMRCYHF